jgi:hypothetical protein
VNKLLSVAVAAIVSSARVLSGFRRIGAGAVAPAILALWCLASWSPGAVALTSACAGATGTSTVTNIPQLFNLQCFEAIQIPGNPLQTFGSSAFVRMSATTASYFLADRSNLGIDLINGSTLKFTKLLKPTAADPVKGFLGQLIYTAGPANDNTGRPGTSDESHSGPNGVEVYLNPGDPNNGRWLYVADGGCNTDINAASYANPASAGNMGACGTPADPSTLPNPLYTHVNCINPGASTLPTSTVCYPNQHQPNVKLFDLKTDTWVASFPTGGGCNPNSVGTPTPPVGGTNQAAPPACTAPLGNYAPGTNIQGYFGATKAGAIQIGVDTSDGNVYVLVASPSEPFQRNATAGVGATASNTTCSATAPWTEPGTPGAQGTTSYPYMTLFTMDTATGGLTYRATIKVDDRNVSGDIVSSGFFGCDAKGRRPLNPFGNVHWDPNAGAGGAFFIALPNVLNNPAICYTTTATQPCTTVAGTPPGPAPTFTGQNALPGPYAVSTGNSNPGIGGCYYPQIGTVAPANEVDFTNNPENNNWFWDCDGGLLMIDPVFVNKGSIQPNFMTAYPQTSIPLGQPVTPVASVSAGGNVGGVIYLPYCSPGIVAAGPNDVPGASGNVGSLTSSTSTFDNLFLGCNPRLNGNTAGTGSATSTVNVAETYSVAVNAIGAAGAGGSTPFAAFTLPGPYPAVDPVTTFAFSNPNGNTPQPPGCISQTPASGGFGGTCGGPSPGFSLPATTGNQVLGGQIIGYPTISSVLLNGATTARLNALNVTKDPHWYVAVGGDGFSSASISTLASKTPVIGYVDSLTNAVIEYIPTSSGSSTLALDETNYVVFLPVNGVATLQLPAGDFTGNGVKMCGNGITNLYGVLSGRGCVVLFRQQYLSRGK